MLRVISYSFSVNRAARLKDQSLEDGANLTELSSMPGFLGTLKVSVPPAVKLTAAIHAPPALDPDVRCPMSDSSVTRDSSDKWLGRIADERWRRERAVRPSEGIPKGGAHLPAMCATLDQLDYFVALALQQHGEQSALRKGGG
jgi:hypothetical protein